MIIYFNGERYCHSALFSIAVWFIIQLLKKKVKTNVGKLTLQNGDLVIDAILVWENPAPPL